MPAYKQAYEVSSYSLQYLAVKDDVWVQILVAWATTNGHQYIMTVTIVRPSIMIVGCVGLTPPCNLLVKKFPLNIPGEL